MVGSRSEVGAETLFANACLTGELMNFRHTVLSSAPSVEAKGDLYLTTLPACTLERIKGETSVDN